MKKFLERYPWVQQAGCGVLICALLLSICLPLMGMRSAEPDNPILQAAPQEITVLQAGQAPGHAGNGDAESKDASGSGGSTNSELSGEQAQPDPEEAENQTEQGQDTQPEQQPQGKPRQEVLADAAIGTNTDSNKGDEGEEAGDTGETDEDLPETELDLGALLTWYKYGSQASSMVCAPGDSVGKRVLLAQLDRGRLRYELNLTGLDADDAKITGVQVAVGNGVSQKAETRGVLDMTLPDGAEFQNYILTVQAHAVQKNQKGETVETNVNFAFVLQLESGIDLDLQLTWQPNGQATCPANGSVNRTVKSDTLTEGSFTYTLQFLGENADDATIRTAEYWATDGESGTLSESGEIQMAAADGKDTETYYLAVTAEVLGQTIGYTFVVTYEDGLDLQLQFTWYEKSVTAQTVLCDADKRAALTIKHNQINNSELLYKLGLTGRSAQDAQITSASFNGAAMSTDNGSARLESAENGATYTVLVTAKVKERTVNFTVTIRYQSDVRMEMSYTVMEDGAQKPCVLTCENKKTVNADPVYDDQLTDGLLTYTFAIRGEEASDVTIQSVKCYQSGSFKTITLPAPSGSVTLLLNEDKTGDNTFTVTAASSGGDSYTFVFNVPYKHRGENKVQIKTNLRDGATITNGQEVNLTVEAWTEDAAGNRVSHILATGTETKLTVQLDGKDVQFESTSGYVQQYLLIPENLDEGDRNEHTLYIYAEDEKGNYGELNLKLIGKRTEEGQKIGTASIYIDMSILGLGVRGPISYDVLSKEPVSYVIAKAIWDYDAGDPFGTAANSFHWPASRCSYENTLDTGFYLQTMDDGSGLGSRANALSGGWNQFGSTSDEILAGIDSRFGADSNEAILWRCIYRNGIPLSGTSTGIGEFDYTMGSGWMYSIGGATYYPGTPMSGYYLKDGDTLTLRYTLAYGWDVGTGESGYGNTVGYCITCLNGSWSVHHSYETVTAEDGTTKYVCHSCGMVEGCPHEHKEYQDQGGGTCVQVCKDCGETIGIPGAHKLEYTADEGTDTHTAKCKNCGFTERSPHEWKELTDTATCTEAGVKTFKCEICNAQKEEESPAAGHKPQNVWIVDEDHKHHYQECQICHEKLMDTYDVHHYDPYGDDWQCSVCGQIHGFDCDGTLVPDAAQSTCKHLVGYCSDCGLLLEKFGALGEFADYHTFSEGVCTTCGAIDQTYTPPTDPDPTPDPNPGGDDGGGSGGNPGGDGGDDSGSGGAGGDPGGGSDSGGDGTGGEG
jgi:hypothetical protein